MNSSPILILAVAVIVICAIGLFRYARRTRTQSGVPDGRVIYDDSGRWRKQVKPLFHGPLQLVGKPDYLVENRDGSIIPVEVKSGKGPKRPHEGHILQLAAYCLLVEENYGVRPDYGIIQYSNRTFEVDYTQSLEEDLLDTLDDMRADLFSADVARSHDSIMRCRRCGVKDVCDQQVGAPE